MTSDTRTPSPFSARLEAFAVYCAVFLTGTAAMALAGPKPLTIVVCYNVILPLALIGAVGRTLFPGIRDSLRVTAPTLLATTIVLAYGASHFSVTGLTLRNTFAWLLIDLVVTLVVDFVAVTLCRRTLKRATSHERLF